ncbi:MAG: radical SAM protein [Clostridia bacterium]|nr:radical SAM protein [Clostridia bacterium]
MSKNYIIPIFVPFFGCPHKCIFCDQEKITGSISPLDGEKDIAVEDIINEHLTTILAKKNKKKRIEIGYYGGSFTGLPFNIQEKLLTPAKKLLKKEIINGIRVSTRPDFVTSETMALLREYKVDTIELGVQSFAEDVLDIAERGHGIKEIYEAAKIIKGAGMRLGIQLMIGLPGDTLEKTVAGAKAACTLFPDFVRIYPVIVLKGTELATRYERAMFKPWGVNQVVEAAKQIYYVFFNQNVEVIRIGLQDSRALKDDYYLAGPYHPAMGEMVQAAVFFEMICYLIEDKLLRLSGEIFIFCAVGDESKVRGQKSDNLSKLREKYPKIRIIIKPTPLFTKDTIGIAINCESFPEILLTKQEFIGFQRI